MRKRILSLILLASLTLFGCGSKIQIENEVPAIPEDTSSIELEQVETPLEELPETDAAEIQDKNQIDKVIYTSELVKIRAIKFESSSMIGPSLKVEITNLSDKDLALETKNVSLNGYVVKSMEHILVSAESTVIRDIIFTSQYELMGIVEIMEVELTIGVHSQSDFSLLEPERNIYFRTPHYGEREQVYDDSGTVILDKESVKIVFKKFRIQDYAQGPEVLLYMENNTDTSIMLTAKDVKVNGKEIDPLFSVVIPPGKKAIDALSFQYSDLEIYDVKTIERIEFTFSVIDHDNWKILYKSKKIKVDVEQSEEFN